MRRSTRTATKPFKCSICPETIRPGERYDRHTYQEGGKWVARKIHAGGLCPIPERPVVVDLASRSKPCADAQTRSHKGRRFDWVAALILLLTGLMAAGLWLAIYWKPGQ